MNLINNNHDIINKLKKQIKQIHKDYILMKNLINKIPGDIYWKDKDGVWIGINKRCIQSLYIMGFISQAIDAEVIGKTDYQLFDQQTADNYRKNDIEVMEKQIEITHEEVTQLPSGDKIVLLSTKKPLWDDTGNIIGILGNTINISYLKKIEEELRVAKYAAEAANNTKTEFIANMSHDIRTPLSGVIGMSELLEGLAQDPKQLQYAQWIRESGEKLLGLLNGILDLVSADHVNENDLREETFDLRQCIYSIAKLERPTIELKGLELKINIDPNIPRAIISDRNKLHRILLNLLGNAIKFTSQGAVIIEIKLLEQQTDKVKLHFCVADTGIGIAKDQQDKVFDRFFRAHSSYKGVYTGYGVGLHIVDSYVKLLGGNITFKSSEGVGTVFSFDLFFNIGTDTDNIKLQSSPVEFLNATINQNLISNNTPRFLLVEDNMIALQVVENTVSQARCHFKSAVDGESAFELVKNNEFDLILTDIGLPGISGIELTSQIRAWEKANNKKPIPIVGLTAHAEAKIKEESLNAGMNDVVNKPANLELIKNIISKFLITNSNTINDVQITTTKPAGSSLGMDLPDSEAELFTIDKLPILDIENAIKNIGDKSLLVTILSMMQKSVLEDFAVIKQAHDEGNWHDVEKLVHKMKGGALSCGTIRLSISCQYLERYRKAGHTDCLEQLYQQLSRVTLETHDYLLEWIKQHEI